MYILFETAAGFFLFFCLEDFKVIMNANNLHNLIKDHLNFKKKIKFRAFIPFKTIEHALENFICLSEGNCSRFLSNFLFCQIPFSPQKYMLGVEEPKLAFQIYKQNSLKTISNEIILEFCRGIRFYFEKILKNFVYKDFKKIQYGMAQIFSQSKTNLFLQKTDNMIIQSSSLLDQIENDINIFSMTVKEWYSWYFPELIKIINDNYIYTLVVKFIGNKKNLNVSKAKELGILLLNEEKGFKILEFSKTSSGSDISFLDLIIIEKIATKVILMFEFKNRLNKYLNKKINLIVPNLSALIGENLAAKLITKAGSLKNLAKFPSSTIQMLGAEKALFRSLKKKTKTPKYGILFNASLVAKIQPMDKGKISRYLANKCCLAIKIDYFSNNWTNIYGKKLKRQILNILKFSKKKIIQ
jgi:nucleolar protein 56